MEINKYFRELNIIPIKKIDIRTRVEFVNKIALRLIDTFPKLEKEYINILEILQRTEICIAKIPKNLSPVNYSYKDQTIYVSENIELGLENEFMWHEIIHRIQEIKNQKGELKQLGICNILETRVQGMSINEAAIQYITSKILNLEKKEIEIYGMKISTISKNYYPILTCLIEQIIFLLGEDELIDSVLNSNNEFKYNAIDLLGENSYFTIQNNFEEILKNKNTMLKNGEEKVINKSITNIRKLYITTQEIIYKSYFDNYIKNLNTLEEIENLKYKLKKYSSLIGTDEGLRNYLYYCENKNEKIALLEEKYKNQALAVIPSNKIVKMFRKIKELLSNLLAHNN